MKKNLLTITICALLCAFISCKKEQGNTSAEEVTTQSSVDNKLISEVTSLKTYSERKAAYSNILNDFERYTVWAQRNKAIIQSGVLNDAQLKLFKQANAMLGLSLFTSKTERYGLTSSFEDWKVKAQKVFTEEQLKYLITDIIPFNKEDYFQIGVTDAATQALKYKESTEWTCGCSQQSDWCGSQGDCMGLTCTSHGNCGTFLVYECNGACSKVIVGQTEIEDSKP
ncbi:bacteriocin fulvocin C-related protein [Mucilaginibacter terrae]|uniref:Bacteriocin fulvocin C-related protein n=1 Tax=Mucilaginibacter terrae TaxID=1955052 RepID=A0ABU3GUA4_9SPHI|nr:bacteriocin fulvocin C-related protein [Mucilaginibacter terrae]MDT3403041.1 hypothetical protein [Mucilaginibacter terrae]